MKKELTIAALTLLLTAAPVMAQSNHQNNGNINENAVTAQTIHQTEIKDNDSDKDDHNTKPTSAIQNTPPPCDPSADWKNHGAFVSCVAHLHHKDIDDAAHSDIGKTNTPTPPVSVTPTETITPEETISPSPSISPTPTASPTPEISDMDIYKAPKNTTDNNFVNVLGRVLFFLSHLL